MSNPPTLGLVLAGGLARRMGGGDKARKIAVGVDDDAGALHPEAGEHALENGLPANPDARLVAAAHAAG